MTRRPIVVVAITGASGAMVGVRCLRILRELDEHDVHLIITPAGRLTIEQETDIPLHDVQSLAHVVHKHSHIGASIASGSTPVAAMVVTPCSIHSLSAIAHGITDDLVSRAADVCLKEGRPLLLLVRESPVHSGHLESMRRVADLGGVIAFPVPAFYQRPASVAEIVDDIAHRTLARVGIHGARREPWPGVPAERTATTALGESSGTRRQGVAAVEQHSSIDPGVAS
ncbi:MAG: UbiX family flavin prenyltransferase [Microbacterium sp.]|uniref:UbiX family flavin prenyltransferase n=1 Tax=Microbacterium sp. TaxID=51671 RepID=UPI0039E6A5E4